MRNFATNLSVGFALLLWAGLAGAAAPDAPGAESCDQIRAQIKTHTGVPARANIDLLRKVGANSSCDFSSAEAYRAAWGDTPLPPTKRHAEPRRHHGHGDDDDD